MKYHLKGGGVEYEYQFPNFNRTKLLAGLRKLKAKKVHKRLKYPTIYFRLPNDTSHFYRVRNEGGEITFTKKILRKNLPALEYEININKGSNYQDIVEFVKQILPDYTAIQQTEKYREKWEVGRGCHEVVIDEWPGLPPYVEIDCTSKKALLNMVSTLQIDKTGMFEYGAFDYYQSLYGIKDRKILGKLNLQFIDIKKTLNKYVTQNKATLTKIQNMYFNNHMNRYNRK